MEKSEPTPYDLRLVEYGIMTRLKRGDITPSVLIRIIDTEHESERRYVILKTYHAYATPEFIERVKKVREALGILQEFDKSDLEETSL